jgi:hypothetical protein
MNNLSKLLLVALFVLFPAYVFSTHSESSEKPKAETGICKTDERVVSKCFWVTGTLYIGSGNPATRIRIKKPRRTLGIKEDEQPILPDNVSSQLTTENTITGTFYFCPFSKYKPGTMQVGCVEKAKNIKVSK